MGAYILRDRDVIIKYESVERGDGVLGVLGGCREGHLETGALWVRQHKMEPVTRDGAGNTSSTFARTLSMAEGDCSLVAGERCLIIWTEVTFRVAC